ncbi:hypothetical protein, partial [Castellaniella sp.]|uniref:hypothetical protein n=1 Tax=Castellaniella sp. TaxID=1955812 RepID=UPI00355F287C
KDALSAKGKDAIDAAVAGLKSKNSELLGSLKTTKADLDALKGQFDGLDIEAVKGLLKKASEDEETRLIAEGKIEDVLAKRTERLRADLAKQLKAQKDRADKAEDFASRFRDRVLSDSIREAATKAGALPEAADDIILRARGTFKLNDAGEPVAMNGDEVVLGKDGKTPLSPLEWAESLKETAPHLWPRAVGAGQTGDKGGEAAKKRSEMSAADMAAFIQQHGQAAYLNLPK